MNNEDGADNQAPDMATEDEERREAAAKEETRCRNADSQERAARAGNGASHTGSFRAMSRVLNLKFIETSS